jgi:diguanylate cyclase (GGDEF)-like protein
MAGPRDREFGDDETPLLHLETKGPVGPKRPCLVVIAGPRLGEVFPVLDEVVIGRDPESSLRLADDEGVSRRHASVRCIDGGAVVIDHGSANGTFVDGERVNEQELHPGVKIRVGQTTVLRYERYDDVEERAQRQLLESALRDGLTHAFNRRYFMQRVAAEIGFAERHGQSLSLLLLDIDHFKTVNDQHGHLVGDGVLQRLVDAIQSVLRAEDVLARYGGDELAVLARGIGEDGALALGERLRKLVAGAVLGPTDNPVPVTVSVGVAGFPPSDGATAAAGPAEPAAAADKLLERADAALYRAKQAGRNTASA